MLIPALAVEAASDFLPGQSWSTVRSGSIYYHYTPAGEPWLDDLTAIGARAYDVLATWTGHQPERPIHVVLIVDNDFANGSATPLPRNTVRLYPTQPRHPSMLMEYSDWLALLFVHELTHIFHLDQHRYPATLFRKIFGRQLVFSVDTGRGNIPYFLGFPNAMLPDTLIEGYAVWAEGLHAGQVGRGTSPLALSLRRNFARTRDLPTLGNAIGFRRGFPGGNAPRFFGGAFHAWVADQKKKEWAELYRMNASGLFPFFWGLPARLKFEDRVDALWQDWRARERAFAKRYDERLEQINSGRRIAGPFLNARGLAVSPDGDIFFSMHDGRSHDRIVRLDQRRLRKIARRYGGTSLAFSADGALWFDEFSRQQDTALVSVVKSFSPGERRTQFASDHLFEPDVHDQKLVAVSRQNDRYCLQVIGIEHQNIEHSLCRNNLSSLHNPVFSPDGQRVAYVEWQPGTRFDLMLWDPVQGTTFVLAQSGSDETQPLWRDDGQEIYFISTRTGAPELFSATVSNGAWKQNTRTPTGVWNYTLTDGDLYYFAPEVEGWNLFKSTLNLDHLPEEKIRASPDKRNLDNVSYETPESAVVSEPAPYRAWKTLWPTGWTPALRLGTGVQGAAGFSVSGEDVLREWSWYLSTLVNWDGEPDVDYGASHSRGKWAFGWAGEFSPRNVAFVSANGVVFERRYSERQQLSVSRIWRRINRVHVARLHGAEEHIIQTNRSLFELGGSLVHDSRSTYNWSLVPADGLFAKVLAAGNKRLDNPELDGRIELVMATGGFMFKRTQWQIQGAGGLDLQQGNRTFTLRPPQDASVSARQYTGRAVPSTSTTLQAGEICSPNEPLVCRVDRFVLWEAETIWPLYWAQQAPLSLPLYFDQLHLRTFAAGAHFRRYTPQHQDFDQEIYVGAELHTSLVAGWTLNIGPVVLGARWPVMENPTAKPQIYLRVGMSFDQFGRFLLLQ